ncbi:MAG: hypothetical protein J1F64_04870, partial [Oscillospiraceae bacterium]|nr:hypothetical protein [Oscillospiraceae bacterium]
KYNIGIGLYKYYNGYFYAANTYENKYGKFLFDGSERKELTKDEYDAIIEEISKLPPAPTASPAPTKAPVPSDSPAATKAPVPSDSPAATKAPVPSNSPAATNAPVPSNSPAATNAPSPEPYREYYKLKSTRIDDNGFNFEFERIDEGSDTQTFIFAVYDGENMKNVYIRYINSDDTVIVPADNVESHNTAKIFIWDSFDSMRPVFNPQECNIIFDQ